MWTKFIGLVVFSIFMAILVVGFIDTLPTVMETQKFISKQAKQQMRVAMIGDFRTTEHADGSTTTERPVFVSNDKGEMFNVFDYGPDFKGELKEGDLVYVTMTSTENEAGHTRLEHVRIDYRITQEEEDRAYAE